MQVDWWTFVAQIFNLIILLFLLRKFLYIPVLKAVDERQKLIRDELNKAKDEHKKAEKITKACQRKMADIELEKQQILAQAQTDAEKLAEKLKLQAQEQFAVAQVEQQKKLTAEEKKFEISAQNLLGKHFALLAEEALKKMADTHLNEQIIECFIQEVQNMEADEKEAFAQMLKTKKHIEIQSAQEISDAQQKKLQQFLRLAFQLKKDASFEVLLKPELICGIAIQADEHLISWNLAGYMQEFKLKLNAEMQQLLKRS